MTHTILMKRKCDLVREGRGIIAKGNLTDQDRARHKAIVANLKAVNDHLHAIRELEVRARRFA